MFARLCNQLLFPLRQRAPSWRRQAYSESLEGSLEQPFFEPALAIGLQDQILRDNCFYSMIFDELKPALQSGSGLWLDVGAMSFFYAPALARFAKALGMTKLLAIEADPKRLYRDFYRREDYAKYYSALASQFYGLEVYYEAGNFLKFELPEKLSGISCFFPFLFSELSDSFGLPRSYFQPESFYRKLASSSSQVILFHQGEAERQSSLDLIKKIGAQRIEERGPFQKTPWSDRRFPVYALVWKTLQA